MQTETDFQKLATENGESFVADARKMLEAVQRDENDEDAVRAIDECPLSLQVREGWHDLDAKGELTEYELLLGTGGPASRIVGEIDGYGEASSAHYEYQDWGTPWTRARLSGDDEDILLRFAQYFIFAV